MKRTIAAIAVSLLIGLIAGCSYVLDTARRATPPASSGLSITRPERPAEPTLCSLTPTGDTPCAAGQEGRAAAYPAPTDVPQVAAAGGYPGPATPDSLPPATVVMPTATPPAGGTPAEPTQPPPTASAPTSTPASVETTATPLVTATPRTPAPTPSDPLDRAMLAAVRLQAPLGEGSMLSEGLGVVLASGHIVAPLHVLYDGTTGALYGDGQVQVLAYDAEGFPAASAEAMLRTWDAGLDLAVLEVTTDRWGPVAGAAPGATDEAGLPMQAPLRLVLLATEGESPLRVMQTQLSGRYEDDGGPWLVAAANLSTGAVGGGVALNAAGQVVGLLQPEGGLAPGQLVRIRPIDAAEPLLSVEDAPASLPAALPVAGEERALRILYRGAEGVNLRSGPSTRASILASLHRDEVYPIVSPGESGGWYPVYVGRGRAGWVAARHPTGTRLAEPQTVAFRSALAQGGEAEVACLSAAPGRGCANLRATPGWRNKAQDDVLTALAPGQRLPLLAGPQQADGLAWWQVRDPQSGTEGWVAEVTASGYRALVGGGE